MRLQASRPASTPFPFRPSLRRPYYVQTARPATLGARIWFRPDGTPRSKLRGLILTSVLSGLAYATWLTLSVVEALDYEHYLLSTLVYIQRVDYDYATVSFADFDAALTFFEELCGYFGQGDIPPEMVESFFRDLAATNERDIVHNIVRDAAGAVHDVLAQSKHADPTETAVQVIVLVDDAMLALIQLVEDANSDETDKMLRVQRLRAQMKDASKSYEVLG
ncbi:hypothetical protein B0H15DRAFT_773949 [Mycena belliarum]|uniref:Uncharacterized protein n=1 Tax=Mycena belliarum TaxID=1033014 RepID=A0AAD6UB28_9AGAR|nr:hypothetical protein B0H15DRAFT_773949 [Mycena belliae]